MGWSFFRKQHKRSIMRRRNILPGQTTLAVWCKWPISDSSSRLLHHLQGSHERISRFRATNFSAGRCATWPTESTVTQFPAQWARRLGPHICQDAEANPADCKPLRLCWGSAYTEQNLPDQQWWNLPGSAIGLTPDMGSGESTPLGQLQY